MEEYFELIENHKEAAIATAFFLYIIVELIFQQKDDK